MRKKTLLVVFEDPEGRVGGYIKGPDNTLVYLSLYDLQETLHALEGRVEEENKPQTLMEALVCSKCQQIHGIEDICNLIPKHPWGKPPKRDMSHWEVD